MSDTAMPLDLTAEQEALIEAACDECCWAFWSSKVAFTRDTMADFISAQGEPDFDGEGFAAWEKTGRQVVVVDFGHFRAAHVA